MHNIKETNMTTQKAWQSVRGTQIKAGDQLITGEKILNVNLGRLPQGARLADVQLDDGGFERCWEGFEYRVIRGED
jgi:hypothetical protein